MKKNILSWRFFLLVVFSLIFLQNQLTAQCWPNIDTPPHSSVGDNYDGRNVAYVTNGNSNSSQDKFYAWHDFPSIWNKCNSSPVELGVDPPPSISNNFGKAYIQISAGDFIEVADIELKNNITLVVCGHLKVTTLVLDNDNTMNNGKLVICEGGVLEMEVFKVRNNTTIVVDGTFIVNQIIGQQANSGNCIYGTGTIVNHAGGAPTISTPNNPGDIHQFYFGTNEDDCNDVTPPPGGVVLPIDLISFEKEIYPDRVSLNWITGSEINNDFFTIERSRDLYGWEVLGFVEGAGNSSVPIDYSFSDLRPLDGLAYYRLKQTDFDGAFKYYGPIAAHYDLGLEGLDFKVMKSFSNWIIAVPNDGFYQVEVYNLQGHRLHSERVENTLSIPAPEGAVVIRVTDGFERSASRVVM